MDINELESFKLSDAVSFHEELNPKLWEDNKLDPVVRDQLLLIAEDFVEYLGISNLKVKDVTISGSNAAYSYTPHSDLDLHVLVDFNELPNNEVYQELFTAKKTLYNDAHDITVRDVPVELYVQDINQPVQSLGEYSIVHDKWIRIPKKRRANFDEVATKLKYEKLGDLIELALKSKDSKRVNDAIALVKRYRKSGLDKHGEFGPENLAYKAVRKQGLVQALYDLRDELHTEKLSIEEAASRDDALIKIKKLLQTAGRTPAEKENIKRIVAKMMQQWNIDPSEIGVRKPVDPLKAKIAKAAYEKTMAADKFKQEWERFKKGIFAEEETDEDYHPNAKPRGPEFPPTMPAGTVRVDVSDVYDWYKLGQHISNLHGLGKHDFGKGPPSTIMAFGSEPEEHKYIQDLEKTGLSTTDIDPVDKNQPKGMKRQKTDPTYNVNEAPRTFAPQETPMQKLVKEYVFFTSLGNVHIDQRGETAEAKQQLLALVQRLSKDSKTFAGMDKQKMEANRDTILNHIHQMMTYAIPVLKKYLPADKWEAKRGQINSVLTAYNNARQINEASDPKKKIQFKVQKGNNKFATTLVVNGEPAGVYQYDANTSRSIAEVYPEYKGKGLGKLLVLHAIYTAAKLGLDFIEDESRTAEYDNVLDSLSSNGYIVDDDGYWYVTGDGENYLKQSLNEASGYIPSEKEKNDPRFKTALTVDVKPDSIKKNAKAFNWKTSRAGIPPQARADGKIK